jgi:wyosine [tRNA(Phe)-imidazoG37] synthetase (radical SAM superfamily)
MPSGVAGGGPVTLAVERAVDSIRQGQPLHSPLPVVFGPVRSRRLGWSLGINNVPPKTCTYACVYCQVGATTHARVRRAAFTDPGVVEQAVRQRVEACRTSGWPVDYATFVPDGEPTLDIELGRSIHLVQDSGLPVAVLTNASLLWRDDVREDLLAADWVSLKIDTVDHGTWRRLNRPIGRLDMAVVLAGVRRFAQDFQGFLATETMLVEGLNDDDDAVRRVADFVRSLAPAHAYVSVPVRPAAEPWVRRPPSDAALGAAEHFAATGLRTTLLAGDQTEAGFAPSADAIEGLIGILAVHPMTERSARQYVAGSDGDWRRVEELISEGAIVRVDRDPRTYLRVDHTRFAHGRG